MAYDSNKTSKDFDPTGEHEARQWNKYARQAHPEDFEDEDEEPQSSVADDVLNSERAEALGRNPSKSGEVDDEQEWSDLKQRIGETGGFYKKSKEGKGGSGGSDSEEEGGLYKPGAQKRFSFRGGGNTGGGGLLKKRGAQLGLAGGVVGLVSTLGLFGSFLNTFRMDHVMKNIDKKAYSRLSASLDVRNKYLMREYVKARITEFNDSTDHDNQYFKANKVETNHPMTDWYRTMRKNGFEEKVLNKQGVYFTTVVDKDGNIGWKNLKGKDNVSKELLDKYNGQDGRPDITKIDNKSFTSIINKIDSDDLDQIFTVDKFNNHKSARGAVRKMVNEEVPWFRIVKRRHLRKDIHNTTGIKNWRLFEKTRDKVAKKKQDIKFALYNKMIDKFYANNPNTGNMLKCLFSDGKCSKTSDPEATENKIDGTPSGDEIKTGEEDDKTNYQATTDKDGNVVKNDLSDEEKQISGDIKGAIGDATAKEASSETDKQLSDKAKTRIANAGPAKKIIYYLISKFTGRSIDEVLENAFPIPDPGKIWTWTKRLAKVDHLFFGRKDSTVSKMVKNARRAQLIGIFATYAMANDQMKSGQLVGDELNDFFTTTSNLGNSEGWGVMSGQIKPEDAQKTNPQKDKYCRDDYQPQPTDFAYFCDSKRPDSGGNAQKLSDAYSGTVGPLIHPIAEFVNKAEDSVFGKVADFFSSFAQNTIGKITDPVVQAFLTNTDLGKNFTEIISGVMEKLLSFMGAGPMFDGTGNDIGNLLVAGGVGEAESSSRASGGFLSTAQSRADSDKLAAAYEAEQRQNESTYERYFSLDSPDSVASTALFAATNTSASSFMTKIGSVFSSFPRIFGSAMTGKLFAQGSAPTDLTGWAGSGRYDIPRQCTDQDDHGEPLFRPTMPLESGDANHYNGTNYYNVTGQSDLDFATARDNDKFYKKLYEWAGTDDNKLKQVETVWNCWTLDARAMGGIGFPFGYNQDGGYVPAGSSSSSSSGSAPGGQITASSANIYWLGDSYTVGMKQSGGLDTKLSAKHWKPTSTGLVGRHLNSDNPDPGGVKQLEQDKGTVQAAGVVLVELGTNDLGGVGPGLQAVYDKIKQLNSSAQIVWVNYYVTTIPDKGQAASDALANFAKDKNIKVLDWRSQAPPYYTTGDGIHPNNYNAITDYLVNQLGEAPAGGGS